MKILKKISGKLTSFASMLVAEAEKSVTNEKWTLFRFYDANIKRWSPVYCAFSLNAVQDEMNELTKKMPKRAFACEILGEWVDGGFLKNADIPIKAYIGDEYENIG